MQQMQFSVKHKLIELKDEPNMNENDIEYYGP